MCYNLWKGIWIDNGFSSIIANSIMHCKKYDPLKHGLELHNSQNDYFTVLGLTWKNDFNHSNLVYLRKNFTLLNIEGRPLLSFVFEDSF